MTPRRTVLLDNEAVQAIIRPSHAKHRRTMALIEVTAQRNSRKAATQQLVVPTTIRVEAGWNRTAKSSAAINQLRATDHILDSAAADQAARVREDLGVSVPDAHLAVALHESQTPAIVLTSDTADVTQMANYLGSRPRIIRI